MPICEVHLVEGEHSPEALARLLDSLSRRYAEILESPIERVRAFVTPHRQPADPYVTALVLEGRPDEQRRRLLAGLADVLVDVLGVERSRVHGRIVQVHPDDWGIGGTAASEARASEIAARASSSDRSE